MEWTDEAIVLSARKHGESAAILQLLTREHGRHAGLAHGGGGGRARGALQPGNRIQAHWRARLADHLGVYGCELLHSGGALLLDDPLRLAAMASACALSETALPEREQHEDVFEGLAALIAALEASDELSGWGRAYVAWELGLLRALGFGLDLSQCAATGRNDELAYVSPRTGRAVSLSAGEPYSHRLLTLPRFLAGAAGGPLGEIEASDILQGLAISGHFLARHVFAALNRDLPQARGAFTDRLRRTAGIVEPEVAEPTID
jgi:DNA repair protein RecO (recombination protein O)